MNILYVCSEVFPFSKTGGLGDVAGALPAALAALGHDVKVVTPLYGSVPRHGISSTHREIRLRFPFGVQTAELLSAKFGGRHEVIFLDHHAFFGNRGGVYGDANGDYGDNARRFCFLSVGALSAAQVLGFEPDVIHLNDWQTALAAVAARRGYRGTRVGDAKTVVTVHNLAYQGVYPKAVMDDLGLPWDLFRADGLEFYDQVNFLKGGLAWCSAITTVSRRYALEIQGPELGCNLDGLLRGRSGDLHGILNGIDEEEWDPSRDPFLPAPFSAADLAGKEACKRELCRRFGLHAPEGEPGTPVFAVVSRLAAQKGIDLLLSVMPAALEQLDMQFVCVGSGDPALEHQIHELTRRFPGRVGSFLGFNAEASHLIEGGADFFVMPSRYEPCGLNQMYSLRYGTVPIVRATGGLDDTVQDLSGPGATGIKFQDFSSGALFQAISRGIDLYRDRPRLEEVRRRGMVQDFSWAASAKRYEQLFTSLVLAR